MEPNSIVRKRSRFATMLVTVVIIIYAPMIYMYSPVHNVLDVCISITRESGRGLSPGIGDFFGPCEIASSR